MMRNKFYVCFRNLESINLEDSPIYWPVLHKLSNVQSQWPQNAVVLPGEFFFHFVLFKFVIHSHWRKSVQ